MTIASANNRDDYTGNGTTANYAYTFRVYAKTDVKVYVVKTADGTENLLTVDTDYRVNNIGESTGTIDLLDAGQEWIDGSSFLDTGYTLAIIRDLDYTQPTEFRNQGTFYPATHEDAIDRSVMLSQQLAEEQERSVKFSKATNLGSFNTELPSELATSGAGKLIVVNDAGDGFAAGPTAGNIAAAEANAVAAAASAAAAATSETNATNAATSMPWQGYVLKTFTHHNNTLLSTDVGYLFLIDATSGATNLYLPLISSLDAGLPKSMAFKRNPSDTSGNAITITTSGVDKIDDASTTVLTIPSGGDYAVEFIGDTDYAPDRWQTFKYSGGSVSTKGGLSTSDGSSPVELAVGSNGSILEADSTEANGVKWGESVELHLQKNAYINFNNVPLQTVSASIPWQRIATGPSGYMAIVGNGSSSGAANSSNYGKTWTSRTIVNATYTDLIYDNNNNKFIALRSTGTSAISTSDFGSSWTTRTTPSKSWVSIAAGDSLVVGVSTDGASGNGAMYSSNTITWTQSTGCQDEVWNMVATDGTTFVAVGDGGKVSTTTDGDTWTARTAAWTSTDWKSVVWDSKNSQFLANGSGSAGEEFMTSPDGITWSAGSTDVMLFPRLIHDGNVYIGVLPSAVYTSVDGVDWKAGQGISIDGTITDLCTCENRVFVCNASGTTDRINVSDTGPLDSTDN